MASLAAGLVDLWHPDEARPASDFYPPGESAVPNDIIGQKRPWFDPTYGQQLLVLRKNSTGSSTYIANKVVTEKAVSSSVNVTVASGADVTRNKLGGVTRPTTVVNGVVDSSGIPDGYLFWAVIEGNTLINSAAVSITQGAPIATENSSGQVDDNAFSANNWLGRWLAADPAGSVTAGLCEVNLGDIT